jgi:hypothetical protein
MPLPSTPRRGLPAALLALSWSLSGCSVFSPLPLWELTKATGSLAASAIAMGPSSASRTVVHPHAPVQRLCIEYNRDSQSAELVPALQAELAQRAISSRVYEPGSQVAHCEVWLRYSAAIEWGLPPMASNYKPYLEGATLALHDRDGRLLATSSYQLDGTLGLGRWADTRSKLAPVVTALLGEATS